MSSLLSEVFLEFESPSGSGTGTATKNKVRQFFCNAADHKKVEDVLKMSVTDATLRSAVETTVAAALPLIYKAIGALRISPRSPTTIDIFRKAFAQKPDWNPTWKTSSMKWIDWGDLIATRLEKAAYILNGGEIRYFCYGSKTHCSECNDSPSTYYACSSWRGRYVTCLGHGFWEDWKKGDKNSMISTLIHEALHIYFGRTVAHTGRSANVWCYLRFVALINSRPMPSRVATGCPASP